MNQLIKQFNCKHFTFHVEHVQCIYPHVNFCQWIQSFETGPSICILSLPPICYGQILSCVNNVIDHDLLKVFL